MMKQVKMTLILALLFGVAAQEEGSCTNAEDCARFTHAEDGFDNIALLQTVLTPVMKGPDDPDPDLPEGSAGHPGSEISALTNVQKDDRNLVQEEKGSKQKGKALDWKDEPAADQENEDDDTNDRKLPIHWLSRLAPLNVSERNFILDKMQVNESEAELFFNAMTKDRISSETTSGIYSTPTTFSYNDGSTTIDNYCPSSERYTLTSSNQVSTADLCRVLSCEAMFYGNWCGRYFYTKATPGDSNSYSACKCCIGNSPTVYKSSQGNRIYSCYD